MRRYTLCTSAISGVHAMNEMAQVHKV